MNWLHDWAARLSADFWPAFADHLWQTTLFGLLVLAVASMLGSAPARVRYTLWLMASVKFLLPPAAFAAAASALELEIPWPFGGAGAETATGVFVKELTGPATSLAAAAETTGVPGHSELYCLLSGAWLAGACALFALWWFRRRVFARLLREGREVWGGREYEALRRAEKRAGLEGAARLVLSPRRVEPGVWRTRRPVVLMPEFMADSLDDAEMEAVMLHELAHVLRRDNLTGNVQMALCCAFWFHPLVWFVRRRLLDEREHACDEKVLESFEAPRAYASGILKVVRFCSGWGVAGVSGVAGSDLRRRVENIMKNDVNRATTVAHCVLLGAAAAAAIIFSAGAGLTNLARAQEGGRGAAVSASDGQLLARAHGRQALEENEAVKEIMQLPETHVHFEHVDGAPLAITDARVRVITSDQLKRADDEGANYFDDEAKWDTYATLPHVTLANVTTKTVKEAGISFVTGGRPAVTLGFAATARPGEALVLRSEWERLNAILPGDLSAITVRLAYVKFTDGTQWGSSPAAPPRPATPPAPAEPPVPYAGAAGRGGPPASPRAPIAPMAVEGPAQAVGPTAPTRATARGGVERVKAVSLPYPTYPAKARVVLASGLVRVSVTVDERGEVVSAEAVSGHPLLRPAAVEAARAAKFEPPADGRPLKTELEYRFTIQ